MVKINEKELSQLHQLLDNLERDLDLIDPKLKEWNKNYFQNQKNRYLNDLKNILKWYQGGKILEVGSVPCHLTYLLKKSGFPIIGIDINPDRSKHFIKKHSLEVIKCDIENEKIPFENEYFDFILFNEIFEHLRIDPISTLRELNRVLKYGKILMLTTPNLYSLTNIVSFFLGRSINDAYEEFEKIHKIGHAGHIREYSTKEVKRFLGNTGFKVINLSYLRCNYGSDRVVVGPLLSILNFFYIINPNWSPMQMIICSKV